MMAQHIDSRFSRPVVCAWCGNRHRSVVPFETTTQGDGCATTIFQMTEEIAQGLLKTSAHAGSSRPTFTIGEWVAKGNYGAGEYDCTLFRFVRNAPTTPAEPICNNCIGERDSVGDLEKIEGNYP